MSFPPVLNGFSHCGIHRDFDLPCRMLPPWLLRAQHCDGAINLSPRSPRCTGRCVSAESHVESWSTGVRVPRRRASPRRSRCSRLSTVYSVARTVGDPVRRTPRPATASPNTFRIRRSAPAYPQSHRGIEVFAPICACPWRRTPGGAHSDLPLRGRFQ